MPIGLAAAQLCHAAGETGPAEPGCYAVVLAAESEQQLIRLADRLETLGVPVHRVVESHGRHAGQLMAIGLPPGPKSDRGRHLSHLPLLRMEAFDQYDNLKCTHEDELLRYGDENLRLRRELAQFHHPQKTWWRRWLGRFTK